MNFVKLTERTLKSVRDKQPGEEVFIPVDRILKVFADNATGGSRIEIHRSNDGYRAFEAMQVLENPAEVMARVADPKASHTMPLTSERPSAEELAKRDRLAKRSAELEDKRATRQAEMKAGRKPGQWQTNGPT